MQPDILPSDKAIGGDCAKALTL